VRTISSAEQGKKIRQPIITVLGHIDHGKTSLLDYIRGTVVQKREAAGITQHIGASYFPMQDIIDFCGEKYKGMKDKIKIPGLLVVDTPGHTAFMNLRKRGGAVADIAIVVIEAYTGTQPTTWEAIRMLRAKKTPFIIAANKIDLIHGWKSKEKADFLDTYNSQDEYTKQILDDYIYRIINVLYEEKIAADRYDRIDFKKGAAVPIVPTSAKTGEGIPTLLMTLIGIVQRFMQERIIYSEGPAKGVVLEVKKTQGMGTTLDCLIYDGILKKTNQIVIGGINGPILRKIKAIYTPKPLDEIRDPSQKFDLQQEVIAAAGVKILAPDLDEAVAGSPIYAVGDGQNPEEVIKEVLSELESINIKTDNQGVILKADTLGSLEALTNYLQDHNIKVRSASVGDIKKGDVQEAMAVREMDPMAGFILGFNVKILNDAMEEAMKNDIRIFTSDVIYRLEEEFVEYLEKRKREELEHEFSKLILPGKLEILPQYIFRRSDPLVVGVRVNGKATVKMPIITSKGNKLGQLHSIKRNNENATSAEDGEEVSVSIKDGVLGRNVNVEDILYVESPESHVRLLRTKYRDQLTEKQLAVLIEYVKFKRDYEKNQFWAA
jgi:translation initiation factor 5B